MIGSQVIALGQEVCIVEQNRIPIDDWSRCRCLVYGDYVNRRHISIKQTMEINTVTLSKHGYEQNIYLRFKMIRTGKQCM